MRSAAKFAPSHIPVVLFLFSLSLSIRVYIYIQRRDESSFENPSGHRVAETTSAPPSPRRILTCNAIRASTCGGIVSAPGVLLLNNIICWIPDGNYPAGFSRENNYPGGIITPTLIIPLVFLRTR